MERSKSERNAGSTPAGGNHMIAICILTTIVVLAWTTRPVREGNGG